MIERVRLATLTIHVNPRGGFYCDGQLGRLRLICEPGLPDRAANSTVDLVLVGDDAEEVHARVRRALLEPAALVADRGVRA